MKEITKIIIWFILVVFAGMRGETVWEAGLVGSLVGLLIAL